MKLEAKLRVEDGMPFAQEWYEIIEFHVSLNEVTLINSEGDDFEVVKYDIIEMRFTPHESIFKEYAN